MAPDRTYRCSDCLDATITRPVDVSHLSKTCDDCGSFARFVNEGVYRQYRAFEESPPEHLDWDVLGRAEKFAVSDQVVRHGRAASLQSFRELQADSLGVALADLLDDPVEFVVPLAIVFECEAGRPEVTLASILTHCTGVAVRGV